MLSPKQLAEQVIERMRGAGFEALLAGGCVRDLLLGRAPKDYDVATRATPDQVLALFPKSLEVGAAFGVVIVCDGPTQVEVATFRSEGIYSDGRRPDAVTFTDARQDALRRDFTINGMFFDPARQGDAVASPAGGGTVVDYVGGREDLAARVIRAIGDPERRFSEDRLRMLRAVRFVAELGFDLDPATAEAIRRMAPGVATVSGERVAAELARLLTTAPEGRRKGLALAADLGLVAVLLPEVEHLRGVRQGPTVHPEGDVFVHTLLAVEKLREPTFELALAALLHDVGKAATALMRDGRWTFYGHERIGEELSRGVCERLRLSNMQAARVAWLVASHMKMMYVHEMREARLRRLMAEDGFEELAELWRADCLASGGTADAYDALMARYRAMAREEVKPQPLVTGNDLIAMGLAPGPVFREILDEVYDAQLEGRAASREDALTLARKIAETRCPTNR
jgi:poly(A) polymerase